MRPDWVKVKLICDRCSTVVDLCSPVSRNVPGPLECTPGGAPAGSPGGDGNPWAACSICDLPWHLDSARLHELVNDAARGGWGEHMRKGAIVLHAPAA